jgi:hypothetical protein
MAPASGRLCLQPPAGGSEHLATLALLARNLQRRDSASTPAGQGNLAGFALFAGQAEDRAERSHSRDAVGRGQMRASAVSLTGPITTLIAERLGGLCERSLLKRGSASTVGLKVDAPPTLAPPPSSPHANKSFQLGDLGEKSFWKVHWRSIPLQPPSYSLQPRLRRRGRAFRRSRR